MKKLELAGQRFGKLLVVKEIEKRESEHILWECTCDCGNEIIVCGNSLRRGHTKSCGCLGKHGMYGTPTYRTWLHMIQRCNNSNSDGYRYYGARGITICERWLKFENFFKDMGERPEGLTIERVNNNEGYCLDNCKWATLAEQGKNKRIYNNNQSGVAGVHYHNSRKRYVAVIGINHKSIHLGYFINKQDAINARRQAEERYRI